MNINPENQRKHWTPPEELGRPAKRWHASQTKGKWTDTKLHNQQTNNMFLFLLRRIRKLYHGRQELAYDHDQRKDTTLNCTTMHTFITKNLYLELECDYVSHRCCLLYDFERCPFEDTIRKWLREYPFSIASKQEPCKGGVTPYFNRVYQFQQGKHFSYLS